MVTLLLTIAGPDRRADFAAPSDTPVAELLQSFIELTAPGSAGLGTAGWSIALEGGKPIAQAQSLAAAGIADGSVLTLSAPPEAPPAPQAPPREFPTPQTPSTPAAAPSRPRPGGLLDRVRAWRGQDGDPAADTEIARPRLVKAVTIAVVASGAGAGTTTVTALLATLLAQLRTDRLVVVDGDPGPESVAARLRPAHPIYSDDLLDLLGESTLSTAQLDANLGVAKDGVRVLPGPPEGPRRAAFDRRAHVRLLEALREHPGLTLVDCTAGLEQRSVQAAITAADQVVLVATPDTLPQAGAAAHRLVRSWVPFTLLVNRVPRRGPAGIDLEELARRVPEAEDVSALHTDLRAAQLLSTGSFTWAEATEPWWSDVRALALGLTSAWEELELAGSAG